MNIPAPRSPGDDAHDGQHDADRERVLTALAALYDHLRAGSRAHLLHGANMLIHELGGVIWIQLPYRPGRRTLPEAGYVSEMPGGIRIG